MTDTSAEAVERIRKYVDYEYTSPDTLVVDSDLVRITADDLSTLLAQRDALRETLEEAKKGAYIAGRQDAQVLCNLYFAGTSVVAPILTGDDEDYERQALGEDG